MTSLRSKTFLKPGFALISVLALVSLAALTATAFLASARLERTATRSIGDTTRLNMALNVGIESATKSLKFIVGDPPRRWNFVTTYWRTNSTNEVGYLFVGKAVASSTLNWTYVCAFTPSSWTNLSADLMSSNIIFTNTVCQATFSNDASTFMSTKGNLNFSPDPQNSDLKCTRIDMVGGRKSDPVGWVYIKQDIRTNPSSTNTANLPVARFAYFTEDLSGLIDADRMGGSSSRSSGTNAEEISLANLTGSSATNISLNSYTNKRPQYLTPGMLLAMNGGVLTNTNDLRYFTSRLPKCLWTTKYTNYDRIPYVPISSTAPYYPTNQNVNVPGKKIGAGALKYPLTDLTSGGQSKIAAAITNSFPMFTSRAGGMNGDLYVNALAANIVDYADSPINDTLNSPTIVNVSGVNAVGYDSYPLLTHLYDQFTFNNNPPTITHTTWMQFWNPSTQSTVATAVTVNFTNNDIVRYTNTTITNTNRLYAAGAQQPTATFTIPSLSPNAGYVTNFTRPNIPLSGFPSFPTTFLTPQVWLNCQTSGVIPLPAGNSISNSFSYRIGAAGAFIAPAMTLKRQVDTLTNSTPNFSAGFLAGNQYGLGTPLPIHDPRMTPYLGQGSANQYYESAYTNTYWRGYVSQTNPANPYGMADPAFWPDGVRTNTTIISHGTIGLLYLNGPTLGLFTNSNTTTGLDPIPCKISNSGSYTNICELGNIFDPIQWRPPAPLATATNYVNTNITSTWTSDSLYGGGSTLRIGRPEHSRFAFTNLTSLTNSYPVPALGTSAAGLLDLFCATDIYDWAGKININTAPLPVLAALAGGITLNTANFSGTAPVNADMIRAFTNGVVKFRQTYPFITPSQLAFISSDFGTNTTFTNSWPTNAVFSTTATGGLNGPTAINDQGREEWFSKIYNLTCVQSFNYRIYVVAQLTDTNGNPKGAMMRKYYNLYLNNNTPNASGGNPDLSTPSISPVILSETAY
jgi:hypothetical protein